MSSIKTGISELHPLFSPSETPISRCVSNLESHVRGLSARSLGDGRLGSCSGWRLGFLSLKMEESLVVTVTGRGSPHPWFQWHIFLAFVVFFFQANTVWTSTLNTHTHTGSVVVPSRFVFLFFFWGVKNVSSLISAPGVFTSRLKTQVMVGWCHVPKINWSVGGVTIFLDRLELAIFLFVLSGIQTCTLPETYSSPIEKSQWSQKRDQVVSQAPCGCFQR